jgi:hypothetical protein
LGAGREIFAFAAEAGRDEALDAVRHAFGRTAALPAWGLCRTWWPEDGREAHAEAGIGVGLRGDRGRAPGP